MASPNPESAILIINDPSSSVDILQTIRQFSRVFARHPIRILRGDNASDRNSIIGLTKKFHIQSVPALITRDNSLLVGRAKICSFLPQLAHAINNAEQRQRQPMVWDEETFREHQLRESEVMDERGEDDDPPDEAGEMSKRMAKYRMEMEKRHAGILREAGEGPSKSSHEPAGADARESMTNGRAPDSMPQQVPRTGGRAVATGRQGPRMPAGQRTAPVCQIRAPPSPAAMPMQPGTRKMAIAEPGSQAARIAETSSSDPFDRKFYEMYEESPSTISTQD